MPRLFLTDKSSMEILQNIESSLIFYWPQLRNMVDQSLMLINVNHHVLKSVSKFLCWYMIKNQMTYAILKALLLFSTIPHFQSSVDTTSGAIQCFPLMESNMLTALLPHYPDSVCYNLKNSKIY